MESELHEILPIDLSLSSALRVESKVEKENWEFLRMLGFGNLGVSKGLHQNLRNKIEADDWRMPLLEIGEARLHSLAGREFQSLENLKRASDFILSPAQYFNLELLSEISVLHSYVLTSVWEKFLQIPNSLQLLYYGWNLTSVTNFKLAFEYRITANRVKFHKLSISELIAVTKKIEEKKLWVLACIGYRFIGVCYREVEDFNTSLKYTKTALRIARENNLSVIIRHARITEGLTYFRQGKLDLAERTYADIFPKNQDDPSIPILLENQALIDEKRQHIDGAVKCIISALDVSTKLDMISTIPGEYLYLGQTYENHYKDDEQAEHYYRLGYEYAMRYASHGISLTGDRKDVVDAYVKLINRKKGSSASPKPSKPADHFAFAGGKAWKEIKDIFQHQLICYHQEFPKNSKSLARKLEMPASTLYSLQDRLKRRGYQIPEKNALVDSENHNLFSFIEEHEDMTWDAINTVFERDIIHYLYEKYGYNKQRMAQVLKLSYPSIITKTRELTQVNEHLLPN